ncbi:unnamed protein product [Paramecium pentaurelia]|uniref:Uncharacterized protein n=1 Tax=Paramecium pentaurelia TaxID=43138 RepID=A0A8S1W1M3_9CILI|nr:unnamed protein product [Paramecium pentaurelia]
MLQNIINQQQYRLIQQKLSNNLITKFGDNAFLVDCYYKDIYGIRIDQIQINLKFRVIISY